jgi:DNA polymerase I-like protein with 3'-5' exonuclease and polymerase domains
MSQTTTIPSELHESAACVFSAIMCAGNAGITCDEVALKTSINIPVVVRVIDTLRLEGNITESEGKWMAIAHAPGGVLHIHRQTLTPMRTWTGVQGGKYHLVQTMDQFQRFIGLLKQQRLIAVDTETSGLDWVREHICGFVFGWGVEHNYYLPVGHVTSEPQLALDDIRGPLAQVLENPGIQKIFWNEIFDRHFLRTAGLEVRGTCYDGVVLVHLLDEESDKRLKDCAVRYVDKHADKWEKAVERWRVDEANRRRVGFSQLLISTLADKRAEIETEFQKRFPAAQLQLTKTQITQNLKKIVKERLADHPWADAKKDDITYDQVPLETLAPYAAADAHYTLLLFKMLYPTVMQHDDLRALLKNEIQLSYTLFEIEDHGVKIDVPYLKSLEPKFAALISEAEQEIHTAVGYPFNINSNEELIRALRTAGVQLLKLTKKGQEKVRKGETPLETEYSVDKEVLEHLAATHEFAAKIQDYRTKQKLLNTYVRNIVDVVDSAHFLHSTFNPNVSTGRMSSREPNIQNIPGKDLDIRRAFTVPEEIGHEGAGSDEFVFVFADYCLAEGTLVDTPKGPTPIEALRTGDLVFTYNHDTARPDCSKICAVKFTGTLPTLVVMLDNGERVRCTPNHRWLLADGTECLAKDLKPDTRLLPLRRGEAAQKKYETLYSRSNREYVYTHKVVAAASRAVDVGVLMNVVHHVDENHLNNDPDNLEFVSDIGHKRLHGQASARRQWQDPVVRARMSAGISRSKAGKHVGVGNPNYGKLKGAPKPCAACNREFYRPPSHEARYCSKACYDASRRGESDLNHRVVAVDFDGLCVPTFDIEVARDHNFALACGVFVHNSQVELRLTAHWSQDPTLVAAYSPDAPGWIGTEQDVHTITLANVVLRQPLDVVIAILKDAAHPRYVEVKWMRNIAKRVNFGIIYGAGPGTIQRQVSTPKRFVEKKDCATYIATYFEKYAQVKQWIDLTTLQMQRYGCLKNSFGRYRRLPKGRSEHRWERERAARQGVNFLIQGDAADLFKHAAVRVRNFLHAQSAKTRLVNFVHDEIQFYWHKSELHLMKPVKALMEDFDFRVPIIVDFAWSQRDWASKKELKH